LESLQSCEASHASAAMGFGQKSLAVFALFDLHFAIRRVRSASIRNRKSLVAL
jgi:hypothetical protein